MNDNHRAFVKLLCEAKERHPIQVYGYYLMPKHFLGKNDPAFEIGTPDLNCCDGYQSPNGG